LRPKAGVGLGKSSGRRRFERAGQYVAEGLGGPSGEALDVARDNVKRAGC
jgi:hypothetical protein